MRRRAIVLRDIRPPATLATSLYQGSYRPIVDIWAAAAERIVAVYERTLSEMTTDAPSDIGNEIDGAVSAFERIFLQLTAALRDWTIRTEAWERGRFRGAVLSATGVDIKTLIGPADVRQTLEASIAWNTSLIKDVSDQARKKIGDAVFAGLNQRQPAREVAARVREVVGMTRRRSMLIAGDQLSKLTSALADERRREAGLDIWQWRHSAKRHPRDWHLARDGKLYSENSERVGTEVDGKTVNTPPDADDWPGRAPFCGCRSLGVLVFD